MRVTATLTSASATLPLRVRHRSEMHCQVVHDSLHRRRGWTNTYALHLDDEIAGFASVAFGGPWTGTPTIFEFYVLPEHRRHAFLLFEQFREVSGAQRMVAQSNDALLTVMLHTYAREVQSQSIVFRDGFTTTLALDGATIEQVTADEVIRLAIAERQGGGEWQVRFGGETVGTGGILFHYNAPYGDIYMDIVEAFRGRGFGALLVQELKRAAYELGAVPAARCGTDNVPSRRTLQKAGFVPYAHMLGGSIRAT